MDEAFLAAECDAMREVRIAPTNDRSVVGVMTEFAFHGEFLWKEGGLHDLEALSVRMSSLILGPLDRRAGSPDRELAAIVGGTEPLATVIAFPKRRDGPTHVRRPSPGVPARRTAAVPGATRSCWRSSPTPTIPTTSSASNGWSARSTPRPSTRNDFAENLRNLRLTTFDDLG